MAPRVAARICLMLILAGLGPVRVCAAGARHYRFDMLWGQYGQGNGGFYSPAKMNIAGAALLVTDRNNNRVQEFDLNGNFLAKFGTLGSGQNNLNSPFEADFDSAGYIYITDWGNGRFMKRTATFAYVGQWGTEGSGPAQLLGPRGLAVDRINGWVFIADTLNHRISKWDLNGTHLLNFGAGGAGPGQFNTPHDVAVGSGHVYVADTENNRVQKFASDGAFIAQWDGSAGGGLLDLPTAVTVAPNGRIFVSDTEDHRIVHYTSEGVFINAFGGFGAGPGQFEIPIGLAVDTGNRVFVADTHHHRIQRFRLNDRPTNPGNLYVTPKVPYDNDSLGAHAGGSTDADGDTLSYRYAWYKSANNSAPWTKVKAARILPANLTQVNKWYRFQVHVWDGYDFSQWVTSTSVKVRSQPAAPALIATAQQATNGNIAISVTLSGAAQVEGQLCNLAGRTVAALPARAMSGGARTILLNAVSISGTKLPAGQYLLRLRAATDEGRLSSCLVPVALR